MQNHYLTVNRGKTCDNPIFLLHVYFTGKIGGKSKSPAARNIFPNAEATVKTQNVQYRSTGLNELAQKKTLCYHFTKLLFMPV